jgi:ketosteroid isomerase-like protein
MTQQRDEAEIRRLIGDLRRATCAKDVAGVLATGADGVVTYSLAPPLQSEADPEGAGLKAWFDTWDGDIGLEHRDLVVCADGDVAFAHGLAHMSGRKIDGERPDLWYRETYGLRRIGGAWKIVHEHQSTPFYMDGSLRAATDLKPQ